MKHQQQQKMMLGLLTVWGIFTWRACHMQPLMLITCHYTASLLLHTAAAMHAAVWAARGQTDGHDTTEYSYRICRARNNPFSGPFFKTTLVSWYQKNIHLLISCRCGYHTSLINFLHFRCSMVSAMPPCIQLTSLTTVFYNLIPGNINIVMYKISYTAQACTQKHQSHHRLITTASVANHFLGI